MATATKAALPRKIFVSTTEGDFILENVPGNAKVTFSKVNPQATQSWGREGYCLRVYTSEANQLAVMTGVISFRDLSIGLKARKTITDSESSIEVGPNGHRAESSTNKLSVFEDVEL